MFYNGKSVLVTGGTGFVGTHFVQELLKQGANVRVAVHNRPLIIKDNRIDVVRADLTRQEDCLRAVKRMDYVIHAAGAVSAAGTSALNQMTAITTNLILMSQMLQASWAAQVDRFLLFSSSTGYPVVDHFIKEDEMWSGPTHPLYFGYGWMRRYLERLGEFVTSKSSMKIALVRPTAVYGCWDNFDPLTGHAIPALIRRAVEKENPFVVWGNGDEARDFLHITDLVRGCLLSIEKHATCDPVNIGYGNSVTIKEIVNIILQAAGNASAAVLYDDAMPTTIPFRMVDISKARRLLGFEPAVSLEDGLKDTVKWYSENRVRPGNL